MTTKSKNVAVFLIIVSRFAKKSRMLLSVYIEFWILPLLPFLYRSIASRLAIP
jgi:hypothetical protein